MPAQSNPRIVFGQTRLVEFQWYRSERKNSGCRGIGGDNWSLVHGNQSLESTRGCRKECPVCRDTGHTCVRSGWNAATLLTLTFRVKRSHLTHSCIQGEMQPPYSLLHWFPVFLGLLLLTGVCVVVSSCLHAGCV